MDDHFDTSGVFEISKFDISKFACMCVLLLHWHPSAEGQFIYTIYFRSFTFSPDVLIRLDYHGKFDREHVSSDKSQVARKPAFAYAKQRRGSAAW